MQLINSEYNGTGTRQFSKGTKVTLHTVVLNNLLTFQLFWEFKFFAKQLSSEKQIKQAIKLYSEFIKQNERENQRI